MSEMTSCSFLPVHLSTAAPMSKADSISPDTTLCAPTSSSALRLAAVDLTKIGRSG